MAASAVRLKRDCPAKWRRFCRTVLGRGRNLGLKYPKARIKIDVFSSYSIERYSPKISEICPNVDSGMGLLVKRMGRVGSSTGKTMGIKMCNGEIVRIWIVKQEYQEYEFFWVLSKNWFKFAHKNSLIFKYKKTSGWWFETIPHMLFQTTRVSTPPVKMGLL